MNFRRICGFCSGCVAALAGIAAAVVAVAEEAIEEIPGIVVIAAVAAALLLLLRAVLRGLLRLRDGVEGQLDLLRSTRAIDGQRHGIARAVRLLRGVQVVHVADRRVADLGDDVTHLKASLFRGAARLDRADEHALRDIVAVLLRHLCGHVLRCDANVRLVGHIAVGHNVLDHGEHIVDGDGEADALNGGVGVARILRGHDADDLAVAVEERAAGVAGVDGAVHLDHVEGGAVHIDGAVDAGDDALAHRERQFAERVADRGDRLADLHAAGLSDHDRLRSRWTASSSSPCRRSTPPTSTAS